MKSFGAVLPCFCVDIFDVIWHVYIVGNIEHNCSNTMCSMLAFFMSHANDPEFHLKFNLLKMKNDIIL